MRSVQLAAGVLACSMLAACGDDSLTSLGGDVFVDRKELTFPQTWIGHPTVEVVRVRNASRASVELRVSVDGPFGVAAERLELPGGGMHELEVRFTPSIEGEARGTLTFNSERGTGAIPLVGVGRTPPDCSTELPCRTRSFDPMAGSCVDALRANGSPCGGGNLCLTDGVCADGACVGAEIVCNDDNACTTDACDPGTGCVFLDTSASCPVPANPCQAAYCDPDLGCAVVAVDDGVSCGQKGCDRADVCLAGLCRNVPVPDGARCGGGSPCQGDGTCQNKVCVQPAPTALTPVWAIAAPDGTEIDFTGVVDAFENVYWTECAPVICVGPNCPYCHLVSATRNGMDRWRVPVLDPEERPYASVMMVAGELVITKVGQSFLDARRVSDGVQVWSRDLRQDYEALFANTKVPPAQKVVFQVGDPALVGPSQLVLTLEANDAATNIVPLGARLIALNASTGAILWDAPFDGSITSVVVDEQGAIFTAGHLEAPSDPRDPWEVRRWTGSGATVWQRQAWEGRDLAVHGGVLSAAGREFMLTTTGTPGWWQSGALVAPAMLANGRTISLTWQPSSGELSLLNQDTAPPWASDWIHPFPEATWGTDLMITDRAATLVLAWQRSLTSGQIGWALQEIDSSGDRTFSCDLTGAYATYGASALLDQRWVTRARGPNSSDAIVAFDVPERRLGTSGWVTRGGNNARTRTPR